ncbi:cyclic peptide export ABC transporter [Colwellia psychrerythraea]|uniref:Cyclic peptide transporter n=1 Tax=Colwellia psychrerythraea TaxID=28229 RepID=A0A099KEC0_COLPS|nr:cyclic peptide export ABC transporter [Colwellia psychrerythraea]KGJ88686.1 cyclic peptide transporter [Colwellia psychrerythraea]
MTLFDAFAKQAPNKVFFSICLGALSGVSYAFLIPIVLSSINNDPNDITQSVESVRTFLSFEVSNYAMAALFLFVCVFIVFSRTISQVMLTRVAADMTSVLRVKLYKRILAAPIDALDKMGHSKLINIITMDVGRIVGGARVFPDLLMNIVTIVGLLSFLMYLNIDVFWFVLGAITFGIITYQVPILFSNRYFAHARQKNDHLMESIRGLIFGIKELKLNDTKSKAYFKDVLLYNEHEAVKADKTGQTIVRASVNYGDMISFFVIGIVCFIFINYEAMSNDELVGVVMALLYITGPIALVIGAIPSFLYAKISLNKVNQILAEMPDEDINETVEVLEPWNTIHFSDICYQYKGEDSAEGFKIGPFSFTIDKSTITFIVGGNGSGKSTLSKLLTLHHMPSTGSISFGNTLVDKSTLKSCRQTITSIYSDYYLFDRLLDGNGAENMDKIQSYLKELALDTKVTIDDGKFSTIDLSDGQKRRLALLVAFLEDKEFYVFDEWAADQDPMFKEFFYYNLLPQLKMKGKAVVIISHDDRYFDIADKILVLDSGELIDCITDKKVIKQRTLHRTIISDNNALKAS